ncbi:MAG TPA: hypothetical protein VHG52_13550, partial [Thermomicrobiales bacterium]|nr:hypothetical protein [Thermomicrobiales bacterium]
DKQIAVESMWQLADVFRCNWEEREGLGWHSEEDWNLFLQTTFEIGQLTEELTADDVLTNDWVATANDFDHDAVREAAVAYELTGDFASLTQPEGAGA